MDRGAAGPPLTLSRLQQRIVTIVTDLAGTDDFGLAGGAALLAWDIGERSTRDLDFFATSADAVDALRPRLEQRLRAEGLNVQVVRASEGFVRFEVGDGQDVTELDLAWDYRMRPLRDTSLGRVLDRDELAADKMLALYGRAEARDFVDVHRLRALYSREQLCALAFEKDRGFVAERFAEALGSIGRRDRIEFDVDSPTFAALHRGSHNGATFFWRANYPRPRGIRSRSSRPTSDPVCSQEHAPTAASVSETRTSSVGRRRAGRGRGSAGAGGSRSRCA